MRLLLAFWLATASLLADAHIFVFHRFGDSRHPSTNITLSDLRKHFDYFKNHGYRVVPLSVLVRALRNGDAVPDNWVVLTIDDSYKSFYENGLPVFKEYGYPFTLFVYTKATDRHYGDFMSWAQVRETAKWGELGFHSHTHPHMLKLDTDKLKEELRKGMALMEAKTGRRPRYFAYPYGEYDDRVKAVVASFGFEGICNQNVGAVSKGSDPLDLDRCALTGHSNLPAKLRYRHLNARWISPGAWPPHNKLTDVHIKLGPGESAQKAEFYVTGHGWKRVTLHDGEFRLTHPLRLTNSRSRLILKVGHDKINTKLLVKP